MLRGRSFFIWCVLGLGLVARPARAATLDVPGQYPTIQAAVDAAEPGDRIRVAPGSHCGATLTKRVTLIGRRGARIIGCPTSPAVTTGTRAGFYLPGSRGENPASGSKIRGFYFDGAGVSNQNLQPLSFGIFARFASDVVVTHNHFEGTVQAITNTAGDRWRIASNTLHGLTLFDCTLHCTGGIGIVIALARGGLAAAGGDAEPLNRPEDNLVTRNSISGTPPAGFTAFSMSGILLLAADHTTLLSNELRLRDNPDADAVGQGILVSNTCCGSSASFLPGSRATVIAFNDARGSEQGIVIDGSNAENTQGLWLFKNRGSVIIEGIEQAPGHQRRPFRRLRVRLHT